MDTLKRWLREPLLHFLLIGAVGFGLYGIADSGPPAGVASKEIRLSAEELGQLAMLYQGQWRRPPTPRDLQLMVENKVQQEVLYREALAMGLDKDDEIVKRRMAQKMQFLAEDVAAAREPSADELNAWFDKNSAKFAQPSRLSLRHLYFSPDRRGAAARDDAAKALAALAGEPQATKLAGTLADPFMLQDYYRERASDYLGKEFGPSFALAVAKLEPGSWQGPIESGFGWHLVFVDAMTPQRIPDYDEIEAEVRTAWVEDQREQTKSRLYKTMRARYEVVLPAGH